MRRFALIIAALISFSTVSQTSPAQAAAATGEVSTTAANFIVNVRYSECLDQVGGGSSNGTPIGHYPCGSPDLRQQWNIEYMGYKALCDYEDWQGNCNRYVYADLCRLRRAASASSPMAAVPAAEPFSCSRPVSPPATAKCGSYSTDPTVATTSSTPRPTTRASNLRAIDALPFSQDYRVRLWTCNNTGAQEWRIQ